MIDHFDTHPFPDDGPQRAARLSKLQAARRQHTWVAVGVGVGSMVVGAGVSMYGANKQRQATKDAQKANQTEQDKQNNAAWVNYLMQRGIAPTSSVETGVIPQAGNYQAVNTRMPLWMTVSRARTTPAGGTADPNAGRKIIGYRKIS